MNVIKLEHIATKEDSFDIIAEWYWDKYIILKRSGEMDEVLGYIKNTKLKDRPHKWREWIVEV